MVQLEEGEKIQHEIRKHPFVIFLTALALVFLALLPIIFLFIIGSVKTLTPDIIRNMTPVALFFYSLWLLGLWVFFFLDWTDYYLDVWYVTDRRIIDVEQKGFFRREIISLRFEMIQDITVETYGFFQTLLKFGHIHIETAGAKPKIVLRNAARPEEVKGIIVAIQDKILNAPKPVTIVND